AAFSFFVSVVAPMALLPIPASQANTILLTVPDGFVPFASFFIELIAALASSSPAASVFLLLNFKMKEAMIKDTAAATTTLSITPI
ncbi:hypothetical protein, partial [Gordonibacter pamelaeae]|uniref:hypothetical protein n=1 Tax=Gordonibacter pamelaeae TaxID=471189 RepID=UPI001D090DA1